MSYSGFSPNWFLMFYQYHPVSQIRLISRKNTQIKTQRPPALRDTLAQNERNSMIDTDMKSCDESVGMGIMKYC